MFLLSCGRPEMFLICGCPKNLTARTVTTRGNTWSRQNRLVQSLRASLTITPNTFTLALAGRPLLRVNHRGAEFGVFGHFFFLISSQTHQSVCPSLSPAEDLEQINNEHKE